MKAVISVKTDQATKERATMIAKSIGLPLGTYLSMCLNDLVNRRVVHFSTPGYMTPYMERELAKVDEDIRVGRNISPVFEDADDAVAYLRGKLK